MSTDFLDQLAEQDVPDPPSELGRQVHQRLNKTLLATHLADLALRGMLHAIGYFALAVLHLITMTLTGRPASGSREGPSPKREPP